jgi:hypothetical protein
MTHVELRQLIVDVQNRQSELANVEVKAARSGTPRRLCESLSAFANRTGDVDVHQRQREVICLPSLEMEAAMGPQFPVHKPGEHWV